MKQIVRFLILSVSVIFLVVNGCTPIKETRDDQQGTTRQQPKQDTLQVTETPTTPTDAQPSETGQYYFTVQLGSFRDMKNAESLQQKATKVLGQTVNSEYDSISQLYKVTVGKFMFKEDAAAFRESCVKLGYKDAFVTEVRR
jgi:cell division protein FtsN